MISRRTLLGTSAVAAATLAAPSILHAQTKTLKINVPPGVDEGTRIRLSGEGEAGARGAPSGDLYIFLHVAKHPLFERQGTTLFANAPISFTTAALGGEITLPGLDGEQIAVKIAPGTQPGREVRHRGAGLPTHEQERQGKQQDGLVQVCRCIAKQVGEGQQSNQETPRGQLYGQGPESDLRHNFAQLLTQ